MASDLLTRWPNLDVASRRERLWSSLSVRTGPLAARMRAEIPSASRAATALWRHDPSAWSAAPDVQSTIANRLGWVDSPVLMADSLERLRLFADGVRRDGFTDVVLLGMGGSSLAPEVLRAVVGTSSGWPRFRMLDSTDPDAVRAAATPPLHTLYVLASKSGTTIEPNTLAAHFRRTLEQAGVTRWADHFIAITDEGTELAQRARRESFRDVFINPSDIGGRYSALSFFGMVPAALMGQDLGELLGWSMAMLAASAPGAAAPMSNPAVALGLAMGVAARAGVDKLTLLAPASLDAFGLWIEQLIAESTGKNGTGIVPIANEGLADASTYGTDRLFVRVRVRGATDEDARDAARRALTAAHAPFVDIDLSEPAALGAEFVRWEIATAVAGALLNIDPFDQPNVQQAKDATRALLGEFTSAGKLPIAAPDATLHDGTALTLSAAAKKLLNGADSDAFLTLIHQADYFTLLAYLSTADHALAGELRTLRRSVRDRTRAATMFGYGPRYLHSTGQLHKGGPASGVFLIITAAPREDVPIPGERFSFGTLELAQAIGDFKSLDAAGRRALHAHLPSPDGARIRALSDALLARLSRSG
jgi:glucose-6-phosphate isomerase